MGLQRLVDIMEKLREPQGCPWDREQTHQSLKRYLIEESYEVLEAVDSGRPEMLMDELGDVLLQVVFHAQIAKENGDFTMDDVINTISDKLVRRHPHVFGDIEVESADDVVRNWDEIKKTEAAGKARKSVLDGVPKEFPALMRAEKIQKKAAKVGFEWDDLSGAMDKVHEEIGEFKEAVANGQQEFVSEELGDVLFALVNAARYVKTDPELALQATTAKFIERFHYIEQEAHNRGRSLAEMTLEEMDAIWNEAKDHFRKNPHS